MLEVQIKEFIAIVQGQVKFVRSDIGQRGKTSSALVNLERLIPQNEEYFGPNAGFDLAKEKDHSKLQETQRQAVPEQG